MQVMAMPATWPPRYRPQADGEVTDCLVVHRAFLFTDLDGFTAWSNSHGGVDGCSDLLASLRRMCAAVFDNGGELVKLRGDGVHASFAEAKRALCCALEIQGAWLGSQREGDDPFPCVRAGLSLGPGIRFILEGRQDYFGCAVNLAARLAESGNGPRITMSRQFWSDPGVRATLGSVQVRQRQITPKGYPAPLTAYQLDAAGIRAMQVKTRRIPETGGHGAPDERIVVFG